MDYYRNKSKLKTSVKGGRKYYKCLIRNSNVLKTPEEEIRQLLIYHLINVKGIPVENMMIEGKLSKIFADITHNGRFDLLIFEDKPDSNEREIYVLFECKKRKGNLDKGLSQLYDYNAELGACYMVVTDGKETYIQYMNADKERIELLSDLPSFEDMRLFRNDGLEVAYEEDGKLVQIKK